MNNLGKHASAPGNDLAAAFGMSLRSGRRDAAQSGYDKEEFRDSNQRPGSPADPVRAVLADKLARMIHLGLLDAGDPLPSERNLCEVFGVARQSVRAALGILEGRLMVAVSHGRRSRILGPGRLNEVDSGGTLKCLRARQASDIYQVLLMLDAQIASLSANNFTAKQLDQLDVLVGLLPDLARDPLCYLMLDHEIRSLIYTSCGNSLLADMAMDSYGHASPQRRQLFADPREIERNAELHASLAKALRERDAPQAALIMREQTETLAALPLREQIPAEDSAFGIDEGRSENVNAHALTTASRGVFWPTASAAT